MKAVLALLAAAALTPAAAHAQSLPSVKQLPPALAMEAAQAALASCAASGFHVAVAIADPDGMIRLLVIDNGQSVNAGEIAKKKAHTSAVMRQDGDQMVERMKAAPGLVASMSAVDPMFQVASGGIPIVVDGNVISAIGVSGAPAGKDAPCAAAGLAKIAGRLK